MSGRIREAANAGEGLPRRLALLAGSGLVAAGVSSGIAAREPGLNRTPLYAETVAFTTAQERREVLPGERGTLLAGSRVLAGEGQEALLAAQEAWLAACAPWTAVEDRWSPLLRAALLDLYVLSEGLPAPVAGWSPRWRYTWPRDVAHTAFAQALSGHTAAAWRTLRFLAQVQAPSGWFEARYDPWTRRSPDGRERQLDGTGWVIWATARVHALDPAGATEQDALLLGEMVGRSLSLILGGLVRGVPPKSPDYWEVGVDRLTLATLVPLLAGVAGAQRLPQQWRRGMPQRWGEAQVLARAEAQMRARLQDIFGRRGYPRQVGSGPDAATTLLAAPYLDPPAPRAAQALSDYEELARRPAGGLAPGSSWRDDGVSWTPHVALAAQAHGLERAGGAGGPLAGLAGGASHRRRVLPGEGAARSFPVRGDAPGLDRRVGDQCHPRLTGSTPTALKRPLSGPRRRPVRPTPPGSRRRPWGG